MLKLDLHTHSLISKDSSICPSLQAIKILKLKGIHGMALTDHDQFLGVKYFRSIFEKHNLFLIPGSEIQTRNPKLGEVLCLFIQEPIKSRNFHEVVDEVKSQDGIIVLAHPMTLIRNSWIFNRIPIFYHKEFRDKIDGLEGINARNLVFSSNKKAIHAAVDLNKFCTGGSDAHTPWELGEAFTCFPNLDHNSATYEDILKEMKTYSRNTNSINNIYPDRIKRNKISIHLFDIWKKYASGLTQTIPIFKRMLVRWNSRPSQYT